MKFYFFLPALFLCMKSLAQKQGQLLVDSLVLAAPNAKDDTTKVRLYLKVSDLYIDIDQQKALLYADSSILAARKMNWERGVAGGLLAFGNVYNFNGNAAKAIDYIKQAITIYKKVDYKKGLGASLNALSKTYEALSDYPASLTYRMEALKVHEAIPENNFNIAVSLSGIANIFYLQKDYKKSLDYSFKALQLKESINNKTSIANELYAIGDTYYEMGDSMNAEKYSVRALAIYKELGNKMGEANIYSVLGKLFRKNHHKSLDYFYQAKYIFNERGDQSSNLFLMQGQIAQVFLEMIKYGDTVPKEFKVRNNIPVTKSGLISLAESYLYKAISSSKENGDKENEYIFSGQIAEVLSFKNDYKNAYENFKIFHFLQDSLYSQENKNQIASVESQREIAIRDKEIEINKLNLLNQRKSQLALSAGLLLLSIIGGLLYWQSRTRKKTNTTLMVLNNELDESNKIKTKFFSILSHDLRSPVANLINFLHLQQQSPDLLDQATNEKHTNRITASAENLLENMEGLLLWSKGQMENFKPAKKAIGVDKLFTDIENNFSGTANVKISFSNEQQLLINTDEDYLKTIMRNLTGNALKALSETTDASIEWRAWEENSKQYLSITDNGGGVSDQQLHTLNSVDASIGIKSGLGLHLVRDMAKAIACTISVNSIPGKGTSFQLAI